MKQQSRAHHYVPQWYQKRFLTPGETNFFYLDLQPETVVWHGGSHRLPAVRRRGPTVCFFKKDLYTLKLGSRTTDQMEKLFFGAIDVQGRDAVCQFAEFAGITKAGMDAFRVVAPYMGAQRFRTPRGLDELGTRAALAATSDRQNAVLIALQDVFQSYSTMWTEGVWEIVRARQSPTKFVVTDDPVTFYCKSVFPSEWRYPNDVSLKSIGTRTIFPLGLDSCLIITHVQLVRNPWSTPTEPRENARFYDQALKHLGEIQFGRELEEDEVLRINYILKRRATRYVAAAEEDWLYPERRASVTDWPHLDDDWFLLPHLWKVSFTAEIIMGHDDGRNWAADEYGRHPGNPRSKTRNSTRRSGLLRSWLDASGPRSAWVSRSHMWPRTSTVSVLTIVSFRQFCGTVMLR
jgi:hypothetical protein